MLVLFQLRCRIDFFTYQIDQVSSNQSDGHTQHAPYEAFHYDVEGEDVLREGITDHDQDGDKSAAGYIAVGTFGDLGHKAEDNNQQRDDETHADGFGNLKKSDEGRNAAADGNSKTKVPSPFGQYWQFIPDQNRAAGEEDPFSSVILQQEAGKTCDEQDQAVYRNS